MEHIKYLLSKIWTEEIPLKFSKGLLIYERQLQAELYYKLMQLLPNNYEVWIEPVIYLENYNLNKVKPDVFITKGDEIAAIIELKFKPWEYPEFHSDIEKLLRFDKVSDKNLELTFGFIPVSHIWNVQKKEGQIIKYRLTEKHLNVFVVFGKPGSEAFNPDKFRQKPKNFMLLHGHIPEKSTPIFEAIVTTNEVRL